MEDKEAVLQLDKSQELTKEAERHPALDNLILAKELSDKKQYLRKNAIIRQLLKDYPSDFSVSEPAAKGIVGITHNPTKFKIHTVSDNLPLTLKEAADKEANIGRLLMSLARAGSRAAPSAARATVAPAARAMVAPAAQAAAKTVTPAAQSAGKRLADITGVTKFKKEEMIAPFARQAGQQTAGEKYLSNLATRGRNVNAPGIQNAANFRTAIDSGVRAGANTLATAGRYAANSLKDPFGMSIERLPILNQLGAAVRGGTNFVSDAFSKGVANPIGQGARYVGNKAFDMLPNQVAGMSVPKNLAKKTLSNTFLKAPSYAAYNTIMPHSVTGLASRGLAVEGARQGLNRVREGTDVANEVENTLYNNPYANALITDEAKDHISKHTGRVAGRSALGETYEGAKRLVNYGTGRELLPVSHDPVSDALHKTLWESKGDMANKAMAELGKNDVTNLITRASPALLAAHATANAVAPPVNFDEKVLGKRMLKNLAIQSLKSPQDIANSPTVRNLTEGLRSLLPRPTARVEGIKDIVEQQYPEATQAVKSTVDNAQNRLANLVGLPKENSDAIRELIEARTGDYLKRKVVNPANTAIDDRLQRLQESVPDLSNIQLLDPEVQKKLQLLGRTGIDRSNPELAAELGIGS